MVNNVVTLASAGGGVKKIQRGSVTEACTVTIEEVVPEKTFVQSVSKGSAGTVAMNGDINLSAASGTASGSYYYVSGATGSNILVTSYAEVVEESGTLSLTVKEAARTGTVSGGTTDLIVSAYSAVLTSSTTISCDGACEWQVIEYI